MLASRPEDALPSLPPSLPQVGLFVDPGSAVDEVLCELELQQPRAAQLSAQAGELASVARELAGSDAALLAAAGGGEVPLEVKDAEAAVQVRMCLVGCWGYPQTGGWWSLTALPAPCVQRCTVLWRLVSEAEALRDGCSPKEVQQQEGGEEAPAPPTGEATAERVAAMHERLAGLRGSGEEPPSPVWLRASSALLACKAALAG